MGAYKEFHRRSIEQPMHSGPSRRSSSTGTSRSSKVLDYSRPPFAKWFVGGVTNLCHNAVDRHLATRGEPEGADLHLHRDRAGADLHLSASCTPRSTAAPRCCARSAWARATAC